MSATNMLAKRGFARLTRSLKDTFHSSFKNENPFSMPAAVKERARKFKDTRLGDYTEFIDNVHDYEVYL